MDTKNLERDLLTMGFTLESKFIPWSQSRNAKEKFPSLNWEVTLLKNGKKILTTDYMAGCGHCPSYIQRQTYDSKQEVLLECETGFKSKRGWTMGNIVSDKKSPILPKLVDFLYSILMDSEVTNYEFRDWVAEFGYDEDSRKAEKMYKECQDIALKLIRGIGSEEIESLRILFQDY